MCYDVISEELHLANEAGMHNITFDNLNPDMCENVVLVLMI